MGEEEFSVGGYRERFPQTVLAVKLHKQKLEACNGQDNGQCLYHACYRQTATAKKGAYDASAEGRDSEQRCKVRDRLKTAEMTEKPGT